MAKPQSKVLVLYTGGTIGMVDSGNGLVPKKGEFAKALEINQAINDEEARKKLYRANTEEYKKFFVLPSTARHSKKQVSYHIEEYDNLIDSSNVCIKHWQKIAKDIEDNYDKYDSFVVLHGTDTMAYTASALSFMLTNLKKTVIVTGSQKPIFDTRTDGQDNFVNSVMVAGEYLVPEVTIFFSDRLIRGNRAIKQSTEAFFGFDSFNLPPLMKVGLDVNPYPEFYNKCEGKSPFFVHLDMCEKVSFLRLYPGIPAESIQHAFDYPYEGVVMQSFGAGNVPSDREDLIEAIEKAVARGVIILNVTQCPAGPVEAIYETGTVLTGLGVISGSDMTAEAALTKLMYVLTKTDWKLEDKKRLVATPIRGEFSVRPISLAPNKCLRAKPDCPAPGKDDGSDTPKGDTPKGDAPKGDTPKGDTPKGDTPKGDTPKGDTPKGDTPKGDTPKADTPKADTPKDDTPKN